MKRALLSLALLAGLAVAPFAQTFSIPSGATASGTAPISQRKFAGWFAESVGTTLRPFFATAPAAAGTLAVVATKTNSSYVSYLNTTTQNNVARINTVITDNPFRTKWNPTIEMDVFTDPTNLTNVMYYFGIFGGNTPPVSSTGTNADYAGFRFINGTDANWKAITNNGVIANQVTTDITTAITADTRYRLKLVFSGGGTSLQCYINGVAAGSAITSALPTTTVDMGVYLQVINTVGGAGTNRMFLVSRVYYEWD